MRRSVGPHPFLIVGLLTLVLFLTVGVLSRIGATDVVRVLAWPLRPLIIPMYLVWLLFTMLLVAILGPDAPAAPLAMVLWGLSLVAGLVPYLAADYLLRRWRRARAPHP